jgi:hypothetical protein
MGYDSYDFFYDHVAPKMVELFKNFNPEDNGETYDKFKKILANICVEGNAEKFQADIVKVALDNENILSTEEAVQTFFTMFVANEKILRKIEYSSGGAIINVDYEGVYKEQEKEE